MRDLGRLLLHGSIEQNAEPCVGNILVKAKTQEKLNVIKCNLMPYRQCTGRKSCSRTNLNSQILI